ncbi:MAG TPA: hypothetical protein VNU19_10015 [Candidatus Acidoferrum sp.]|nr:hypothetical protein [Candidatus Acidoferrum sp.]
MRSYSELAGKDLRWHVDLGYKVPVEAERHYVLYEADEPVVTAQAIWERLVFFDLVTESGEGTYQVHIDLTDAKRRSVAWKAGESTSLAGFVLESEGPITAKGWITTASGRSLIWEPTLSFGLEYVVFAPAGPRLITVSAALEHRIGGTAGNMLIASEAAGDPELPALAGLGFALACEQVMLLHRSRTGP